MEALQAIERALRRAGLIVHSMEESGGLVPGKPAELVRVSDVLAAVRFEGEADIQEEALGHDPRVETFFARLTASEAAILDGTTIADLLAGKTAAATSPSA